MSTTKIAVCLAALAASLSTSAFAGSCPADKVKTDAQKPGATKPVGVDDRVIGSIELAKEAVQIKDHKLRLRRLVIQPGGVVPWHSHSERPAIIYVVSGKIVEYRSTCAVPIVHRAGESTEEVHATSHWWKNRTSKPVVLLSADLLHDKDDQQVM